jgi:hypothetical protein
LRYDHMQCGLQNEQSTPGMYCCRPPPSPTSTTFCKMFHNDVT